MRRLFRTGISGLLVTMLSCLSYTAYSQNDETQARSVNAGLKKPSATARLEEPGKPADLHAPSGDNIILNDGFEGAFPGAWNLFGNPTWGVTNYRKYAGNKSAYAGGSSINPPGPYPPDMSAWMTFGPFSLANAESAILDFKFWLNSELGYDFLYILASTDDVDYYGTSWTGNISTWTSDNLDLSDVFELGNLLGKKQVWIAFVMESDLTNQQEGAYVDNVVLTISINGTPVTITPILNLLLLNGS